MTGSGASSRHWLAVAVLTAVVGVAQPVAAQGATSPAITFPADGQVVEGLVSVKGVTDLQNFSSAELAFGYDPDPTDTWFTIQTASVPVADGVIALWDTTSITDGDYALRLRVTLIDGSFHDASVKVRVRNYTAVPSPSPEVTPTQTPVLEIPTAIIISASGTPTSPPLALAPTPTALPPNPAGVTPSEVFSGFWRGALVVGLLVLGFGALVRFRR